MFGGTSGNQLTTPVITDNTVEEENYNANDYSKETAEEMR